MKSSDAKSIPVDERKYMSDLHFENEVWKRDLEFYGSELTFLEERLGELLNRNTKVEVTSKVEQFQNKFIRHREVLDELRHDIRIEEDGFVKAVEEQPIAIDHKYFRDHKEMRERMDTEREIYAEMKKDFMRFLGTWL